MAKSLWSSVQGVPEAFATASALFHQVTHSGQVVRAGSIQGVLVAKLKAKSSEDLASLMILRAEQEAELSSAKDSPLSKALVLSHVANPGRVRSIIESSIPWSTGRSEPLELHDLPLGPWRVAVVGAHPSLGADVAFAVKAAAEGSVEELRYFGLSWTILSYSAAILAVPLLVPDEKLMTKWLPAVRWGSLEFDLSTPGQPSPCLMRVDAHHGFHDLAGFQPWMNQSTLQSVLEGQGTGWIKTADYYRFPHVLHFHSVASLVRQIQGRALAEPLAAVSSKMRSASRRIRSQTLAAYRRVLHHTLGSRPGRTDAGG
eukprot:Skav200657  [mRNA]  locus=scaffold2539:180043:184770:- [translate_table: standard]